MLKIIVQIALIFLVQGLHAQVDALKIQIEKILRYDTPVDFNVVPGIAVGVIDLDSIYTLSFGNNIDQNGIYELGSVTKPIVAWLVNKALDSLGMENDTPICSFLPDSICTASWQKLTINEILNHRTGLPRMPAKIGELESDVRDPYKDYTQNLFANDLRMISPVAGMYSYSNIGYAMLYWFFQKVGGIDFFAKKMLTDPYSMRDTKWSVDPLAISPGFGMDGRPQPPWNTNALMTAIGLKSSLNDLLAFINLSIRQYSGKLNEKDLKKEIKTLSKSHQFKVVDGWFVIQHGNSIVFYHTGRTGGHQVSVAFIPKMKKGVVVISNGALGSNDLSLLILRMLRKEHLKRTR
ncbi:MAG: serine hydrolase domain-containing protein [Saprospiraceae bacterium]